MIPFHSGAVGSEVTHQVDVGTSALPQMSNEVPDWVAGWVHPLHGLG